MRRALLAAALLATAAVAVLVVVATASGSPDSTRALSEARVCGADSFSAGGARCIVDERAGLRSNVLHCSARAEGLTGTPYTGTFSFEGKRFPARAGVVPGDGWIYSTLRLPGGAFPAGKWSCAFAADGTAARVGFRTSGTSGTLTSAAACPTGSTVVADGVRACRTDASADQFAATNSVTCSALYSLSAGHTASARLLYGGKPTGLSLSRKLPLPVSVLGMQVTRADGLLAGRYTCEFALDGKKLGTRSFVIAPSSPFVPPSR